MPTIELVGSDLLNAAEKRIVDEISRKYYPKIKRAIKNEARIVVHAKTYHDAKKEQAKKFSIHLRVDVPNKNIRSAKADDWDLRIALHSAFKDVERQLQKQFKDR